MIGPPATDVSQLVTRAPALAPATLAALPPNRAAPAPSFSSFLIPTCKNCLALTFSPDHNRGMKPLLTLLILVGFLCSNALAAGPTAVQGKRIQELNVISTRVLQRSISRKF